MTQWLGRFCKVNSIAKKHLLLITLAVLSLMLAAASPIAAAENEAETSGKVHHWALAWWSDSSIICNLYLDKTGEPLLSDVSVNCGEDVYMAWKNTPACTPSKKNGTQDCKGLYLLYMGLIDPNDKVEEPKTAQITTTASAYNCAEWGSCEENPSMLFTLESDSPPMDKYNLVVIIDKSEVGCESNACLLDMPITEDEGVEVKYWAETTNGNALYERTFKMRNLIVAEDDRSVYRFNLLGNEWLDRTDAAANIWDMFPDVNTDQAGWMKYGDTSTLLFTDSDYALLAGQLIWYGYVDASECEDKGLLENGNANECGEEKARDLAVEWQNRFNDVIFQASQETRIPPRVIKGLIAQESQFWPLWQVKSEFGYGMITENGIDLLLNWNVDYYLELCNRYYTPDQCAVGYSLLSEPKQQFLRGACLLSIGTDAEFVLLADILKAACAQTDHLVETITGHKAADVFTYETLWRVTLGMYTAGVGCMSDAISYSWGINSKTVTWEQIKKNIQPGCEGAKDYFDWVVFYGDPE